MAVNHFDLIVIGSGPAGERGAAHAAQMGKKVAIIERDSGFGGTVASLGTLPSKTLREVASHLAGFRQRGIHGVNLTMQDHLGTQDLLYRERLVRQLEQARIRSVFEQGRITVYHGSAVFVDATAVRIRSPGGLGEEELLSAQKILIATGSSPCRAELFRVDHPEVYDSETILRMQNIPKSMAVVGGGVIAVEYASIFAALGVQLTLVEEGDRLLTFLDRDVSSALLASLRSSGVDVRLSDSATSLRQGPPLGLTLRSGASLQVDTVLVCTGRTGNSTDLGLQTAGINTGDRGFIPVGPNGETSVEGIYAAGDIVGFPALASAAREQAVRAVTHAFGGGLVTQPSHPVLYGIYTIPECSMAGESEEGLNKRGVPWISGIAHYPGNTKGQIIGARVGFVKLLFHRQSMKLLGVHIIGEQASELVHIGLVALQTGAGAQLFVDTPFNYPTLGDLYKAATFDALAKNAPQKSVSSLLRPKT